MIFFTWLERLKLAQISVTSLGASKLPCKKVSSFLLQVLDFTFKNKGKSFACGVFLVEPKLSYGFFLTVLPPVLPPILPTSVTHRPKAKLTVEENKQPKKKKKQGIYT